MNALGFYFCICDQRSCYGPNCEYHRKPCTSFECYNNGTCVDSYNETFCLCPRGFRGLQCQYGQYCALTCLNGGSCNSTGDGCLCPFNFGGPRCETVLNLCYLLDAPCKNGGTCLSTNQSSYACTCPTGFTSFNCDIALSVRNSILINLYFICYLCIWYATCKNNKINPFIHANCVYGVCV